MREPGAIEARMKQDCNAALKAGDKRRREALNVLIAALKKERIDSGKRPSETDELVVLKRERKRRAEAMEIYLQAGRTELAEKEKFEDELLAEYLPEELTADELGKLVDEAIAATGAASPKEMGKVMGSPDAARRGPRRRQASSATSCAAVSEAEGWPQPARTVIDLDSNSEALALAGEHDAHLKILEQRLSCDLTLRGNVLILEGEADACAKARSAIDELLTVIKSGRPLSPPDGRVPHGHRRELGRQAVRGLRRRRLDPPRAPDRAAHGQPEALRRRHPPEHHHLRHRPGRHRQDLPGHGHGGERLLLEERGPHHPDASRPWRRGRASASCRARSPRRSTRTSGPLFDALYDMIDAERLAALIEKGEVEVAPLAFMRGRTLNDSFIILDEAQNTSPEQMKMFLTRLGFGAKMVVTGDITQIDLPGGRRSGPGGGSRRPARGARTSASSSSTATTSCDTSWCSASSTPTGSTASARRRARGEGT